MLEYFHKKKILLNYEAKGGRADGVFDSQLLEVLFKFF